MLRIHKVSSVSVSWGQNMAKGSSGGEGGGCAKIWLEGRLGLGSMSGFRRPRPGPKELFWVEEGVKGLPKAQQMINVAGGCPDGLAWPECSQCPLNIHGAGNTP